MDLRYLETFLKVCDLGSFTLAAEALGMSQPGVSKQIQRLEADLCARLLRRDENTVALTELGRQVYQRGRRVLAEWEALVDVCKQMNDSLSGQLRIGASTIPAKHLLPSVIARFHETYPCVELAVCVHDSKQVLEQLQRGAIELAYIGKKPEHPNVDSVAISNDHLVVIAEKGYQSDASWTNSPFVLREVGSGTRIASEHALASMNVALDRIQCAAEVNDTGLMLQLVERGMGLAIVSCLDVKQAIADGRVSVVHEFPPSRQFYMAWRHEAEQRPLIRAFLQLARG